MIWWVTVFITEFYLSDINTRRHPGGKKECLMSNWAQKYYSE